MAFIPVPNTAELLLIASWVGQEIITTFNFLYPDPIADGQLAALVTNAVTVFTDEIAPVLSNRYALVEAKATDLTTSSSGVAQSFPAVPVAGELDTPSVFLNVAMVISESTDNRGRSFRGRIYVPGIPANATANAGQMEDTTRGDLLLAYVSFITQLEEDHDITHVVVSRQSGGAPRTTGVTTEITGYSANVDLDSQRRRLVGRGA